MLRRACRLQGHQAGEMAEHQLRRLVGLPAQDGVGDVAVVVRAGAVGELPRRGQREMHGRARQQAAQQPRQLVVPAEFGQQNMELARKLEKTAAIVAPGRGLLFRDMRLEALSATAVWPSLRRRTIAASSIERTS